MDWLKGFIFSFLTLFSEQDTSIFELKLLESFSSMDSITQIYPELEKKTVVARPPNTILDLFSYQAGGQIFCLTYRTPYTDIQGELTLWRGKCDDKLLKEAEIKEIKELEIQYKVDEKKLSMHLEMRKGSAHQIDVTNRNRIYFGQFTPAKRESMGTNPDLKYKDGEATFCHRMNENCQEVISNQCDRCAYGWYEVVDYSCPGVGGSKICGPSRCGERGEPACVRGLQHGVPPFDICSEGSNAGFCQKGLETICDENKILICK
jgi:hypothetical protein